MRLLNEIPQKDGQSTEYACGLIVTGGWSTRLEKHKEFINTKIGKYILEIESELKKLRVTNVSGSDGYKCNGTGHCSYKSQKGQCEYMDDCIHKQTNR